MTSSSQASTNGVIVISSDAVEYQSLLAGLAKEGAALAFAETAAEALPIYRGQNVMLAQPDLAASVIDQMPSVNWVQSTWAGIRPLLHTQRQNFILTGIKNAFGPPMAEYTLGQLLAHELQSSSRLEKQQSRQWWQAPNGKLAGKTLGIMGLGSIGQHIARVAAGFSLKLVGLSRSGAALEGFERVFAVAQLHDFLGQADYVVAILPDTPATTGLMNAESFAAMKPSALFINIGRGNLVDEEALVSALQRGELTGAVLDVFRTEPLPLESPLWTAPNLVITAHVSGPSCPQEVAEIFSDNLHRYQQQQELNYLIDRKRGY